MISEAVLNGYLKKSKQGKLSDSDLDCVRKEFSDNEHETDDLYTLINIIGLNACYEFESKLAHLALCSSDPDIIYISLFSLIHHFGLHEKYAPYLKNILQEKYHPEDDQLLFDGLRICCRVFKYYKESNLLKEVLRILYDDAVDGFTRGIAHTAALEFLGLSLKDILNEQKEEIRSITDISPLIKNELSVHYPAPLMKLF